MTTEAFILRVFRWVRGLERAVSKRVIGALFRLLMRLRGLVMTLPEGILPRQLQWNLRRWELQQPLADYNDVMQEALLDSLRSVNPEARGLASQLLKTQLPESPYRSDQQILSGTFVLAKTLRVLFNRVTASGESLFMRQQKDAIERVVQAGFLAESSNEELAAKVVATTRRQGVELPLRKVGTLFNKLRARTESVIAAALWDAVNKELKLSFELGGTDEYEWHAVLDPRTCPICWELDGQRSSSPSGFAYQPPVHPNCRCLVLPVRD